MRVALKMLAVVLLALPLSAVAQKSDPWAGTWKINLAKSTFPGPPPQTEVLTIKPDGTISLHEVGSNGNASDWTYKPVEGQPVQVMGRKGTVLVTVHHILDAHRRDHDWNSNGKLSKSYTTVTNNGKTQTYYALGSDGKPTEIVVYEKQ